MNFCITTNGFDDSNESEEEDYWEPDEIVPMLIDGVLDLHTFSPKEIKELVPDYLSECREKKIFDVRIIHGKGKGVLRRIVHSALDKLAFVKSYKLSGHGSGGWGSTQVDLEPL